MNDIRTVIAADKQYLVTCTYWARSPLGMRAQDQFSIEVDAKDRAQALRFGRRAARAYGIAGRLSLLARAS